MTILNWSVIQITQLSNKTLLTMTQIKSQSIEYKRWLSTIIIKTVTQSH